MGLNKLLAANGLPATDLIEAVYQGVLERGADAGGLEHWMRFLGDGGEPAEMLRLFLRSEEYRVLSSLQREPDAVQLSVDLPKPARSIAIVSNCQGENLGRCIQALTGTRAPPFHILGLDYLRDPAASGPEVRALFANNDVVLIQPSMAEPIARNFPELEARMLRWPSISFAAFHPDLCYVRVARNGADVRGPLGPYHSSIVFHAWQRGLAPAQAVRMFREEVFEELRFFDYWDSSRRVLLEEGERAGLPLEGLFNGWSMRGCFMHSTGHPRLHVLLDLAQVLLRRLEIPVLPVDPLQFLHDNLADHSVWPLYPEIGEHLGLEGAYVFKGINPGLSAQSPVLLFGLEEFVHRSYADYELQSRGEELVSDRPFTERYAAAFSRQAPPRRKQPERSSATHAYAALPPHNYWRRAVAQVAPAEVDPVGAAAFTIDRSTRVASAGSCFAQHISRRLRRGGFNYLVAEAPPPELDPVAADRRGFGVFSARYGNLYTARQLLQLFDRAHGRLVPEEEPWLRPDGRYADPFRPEIEPGGYADPDALLRDREAHLAAVRSMFATLDVLVFTLGLTECWRSRSDGTVFPVAPGVAAGTLDPARHEFVNLGIEDIVADLRQFLDGLAWVNPGARLILTVSPVPLAATYEAQHVLPASTYSKSVLRAAAETLARTHPRCAYFPAYEVITGSYARGAYFGADLRTVTAAGVDHVMRLFMRHYAPQAAAAPAADAELAAEARRALRIVCEEQLLDAPPV